MIKDRDIVVVGIQPWDIEIGSNCKDIANEMSKNHRVLYVNAPLNRRTKVTEANDPKVLHRLDVINGKKSGLTKIKDNLWNLNPDFLAESINKITIKPIYNFLNRRDNARFAKSIRFAMEKLGFKNVVLFNDSLMFLGFYLKEMLKPSTYIYYIRDNLTSQSYFKVHGERLEPKLIKKADLVMTNSIYFENYARQWNPNSYMIGQGCEVDQFKDEDGKIAVPDELAKIKKPIIGYLGFLTGMRLDLDVIETIAKHNKEWSVVLVGPEDEVFKNSILHQMKNVFFLGSKTVDLLPGYVKGFDVCINPQIVNDMTIGNYPRKIDEYLAMGKPTIATQTEAMEYFGQHVYLAKDKYEYPVLIEKALAENSAALEAKRKEFASQHTWENNVKTIIELIEKKR